MPLPPASAPFGLMGPEGIAPVRPFPPGPLLLAIATTLRPKQWTKNLVIFAGLLFSQHLFAVAELLKATLGFLLFCLLSGGVYMLNDIVDRENDRAHPQKCRRPIASGALDHRTAGAICAGIFALGLPAAYLLEPAYGWTALGYVALLVGYSFALKHVVIVDVLTIAVGFVLRAVAGAVVIRVQISSWLLICTILLALFLALGKRRHELLLLERTANGHRPILEEYNAQLLDQMIAVVTASTVTSYALYTMSAETVGKLHTPLLPTTIPFVLYGIFRYLYLLYRRQLGGSPSELFLEDRPLLVGVALWVLAVLLILYL